MKQLNSENLKQIISGIPKGFNIQVDGKECTSVSLGVNDDGVYYLDFVTTNKTKYDWSDEEEAKVEHDGCVGCKYIDQEPDHIPCRDCKQNYVDNWRRKWS